LEWWAALVLIFVTLLVSFATGLPVAFAFMAINICGLVLVTGTLTGLKLLPGSIFDSTTIFAVIAVPMFFLLGEILFHAKVIDMVMDATDKWIGRIRARLLFVCLGAGTGLAALTGSGMADTALLGTVLYPSMEKRGYDPKLSIGVITSSGLLAAIIPPSSLAVLLASIAQISTGKLLVAGILPGLMIASVYAVYIAVRVILNPSLAPKYEERGVALTEKLLLTAKLAPLGLIVFTVMGFILLGVATPSEAAATGALSAIVVTALYRRLNFTVLWQALEGVVSLAGMVLILIAGSKAFGQLLAYSGATQGFIKFMAGLPVSPGLLVGVILLALFILGLFVDPLTIMLVAVPILNPLVAVFGWDPTWFYLLFLVTVVMGGESPPFGMSLFVLKGVIPHVPISTIYRAQIPFILLDMANVAILAVFPQITLWLPNVAM
jgi:tripartite ATP-independent transporter DctM subunit